ncbi:NAD(P)H-dependent oxidoreductase [Microvirga terrae]|uniref:NAD(P)H-dependent oxidoreductase n=1 Tax=Microvirga terrae TaxID=2740529 RepID=A0ABY5RW67_9HYPH|nr:NAD(P)H-dependent oxidoreductase [Microvirga terrae]UVF21500.1 NAD(P)H-dependent oxidoreductase [Microvirga terrae]
MTRIVIIQGHPTSGGEHFCHALADAYAEGAFAGSHHVRFITVADLDFPLLRSKADWDKDPPPAVIVEAQRTLAWAEHLVIIYPLWLGGMPALLKGFLEQALRPTFLTGGREGASWKSVLKGRSSRIVITMSMPASRIAGTSERTASRASSAASCPWSASARTGRR